MLPSIMLGHRSFGYYDIVSFLSLLYYISISSNSLSLSEVTVLVDFSLWFTSFIVSLLLKTLPIGCEISKFELVVLVNYII